MNAPVHFDDPTKLIWWQRALKGERGLINANEPMTGYYRASTKNKQTGEKRFYAVAYWWHNGKCFCKVNGPGVIGTQPTLVGEKHQQMLERWPFASKEPIPYDVYLAVVNGSPWPDQHVAEKAAPAETSESPLDVAQASPLAAGAAEPEPQDNSPQGLLKREIEAALAGVPNYVKRGQDGNPIHLIESDQQLAAAQALRAQLLALYNTAKKALKEANSPLKEKIDANDRIWMPLEHVAKQAADGLRDGPMKAWELHKRQQAATAAKAAAATGAPAASNAPPPSTKIKGTIGRAARVEEVKIAVIHDFDQVYAHFRDDLQVKAILQGLSNAAVRAGLTVPGTTTEKDVKIT